MMLRTAFLFVLFVVTASFSPADGDLTYKTNLVGKNISETVFGGFTAEEFPGEHIVLVVAYGCGHCFDATIELGKLKKENLAQIHILGTGTEAEKKDFRKETSSDYPTTDYNFETMKEKLKAVDPGFPPPPFALWIKDNVIKAVFVKMPSPEVFKKMQKEG